MARNQQKAKTAERLADLKFRSLFEVLQFGIDDGQNSLLSLFALLSKVSWKFLAAALKALTAADKASSRM